MAQKFEESAIVLNILSDAAMADIRHLEKLEWLDLSQTGVTDASVKDLKQLKNLRVLRLENTKVTDAGVKELREALSNCRIDHPAGRGK